MDSFETELEVPALAGVEVQAAAHGNGHLGPGAEPEARPFHGVFIRAPLIERTGPGVAVLANLGDGRVVAARQGKLLATAFHPELTGDGRVHRYFLDMIDGTAA